MILVTGACRSGSSLVMQTLQLLGIPIAGEAHHPDFPVEEGNPKGYYDLPFYNLVTGVDGKFDNKAVKLFGTALPKIMYPERVTHAIVCCRKDTKAQDASTRKLMDLEMEIESESPLRKMAIDAMSNLTDDDISSMRRKTYKRTYEYLEAHDIKYIKVYYEDMQYKTLEEIQRILEFLQIRAKEDEINEAKENVDV